MKHLYPLLTLPLAFTLVAACGGDAKKDDKGADKKEAKADDKGAEKAPPPVEEKVEAPPAVVEGSPEMKAFLAKFDGKSTGVEAALKEFGVEGLASQDMGMYDLTDPKVVAAEGDCFDFEAGAGMTVRTYRVCWEGGKIKTVEDKGMR